MKKVAFFLTIAVSILIINGLVKSIYDLWSKKDLLIEAQKRLDQEKKENQELKKTLSKVKTNDFIEEEARNKLVLLKPGEKAVILASPSPAPKTKNEPVLKNYQKWLKFFGF